MKRLFIFLVGLMPFFLLAQNSIIIVHGTVTDSVNNVPVFYTPVNIMADSSVLNYAHTVYTDSNGMYVDTIVMNFNPNQLNITLSTPKCNGAYQYDMVSYVLGGAYSLQKDFLVCPGGGSTCQASYSTQVLANNVVQFTNFSVGINPNSTLSYLWDFGGGTGNTTAANPMVTYPSTGNYYVSLSITDNTGCTSTMTGFISVVNCHADFTAQLSSNIVSCQNISSSPNQVYVSTWTVNNQTFQIPNLLWVAPALGTYNVCLTILDSISMCSDTYCQTVNVTGTNSYDLHGYVIADSMNTPVNGDTIVVYLIQHDAIAGTLTAIDSTFAIANNNWANYQFNALPAGDYLVKAAIYSPSSPFYGGFMPTYSDNSLFWSGATTIVLPSTIFSPSTDYYIHLQQGVNPGGPGFIGGLISQGANKMSGVALPNRQVMLLNMNDSPVVYTYSDANGEYSFSNLAYGTYKVYTEVLGKPTEPIVVSIDATNPSATGLEVVINSTGVTTVIYENFDRIQTIKNVYPNPISGKANLDIALAQNTAISIEVLNLLGQVVYQKSDKYAAGAHQIELEFQTLESGIYMMRIFADGNLEKVERLIKE